MLGFRNLQIMMCQVQYVEEWTHWVEWRWHIGVKGGSPDNKLGQYTLVFAVFLRRAGVYAQTYNHAGNSNAGPVIRFHAAIKWLNGQNSIKNACAEIVAGPYQWKALVCPHSFTETHANCTECSFIEYWSMPGFLPQQWWCLLQSLSVIEIAASGLDPDAVFRWQTRSW